MRRHLHLAFDAELVHVQGVFDRLRLVFQPVSSPANEIGREQDERLLQIDGRFGTHLEVVQVKHPRTAFFSGIVAPQERVSSIADFYEIDIAHVELRADS